MAKPGGRLICPILRFAAARGLPLSSGTDTFSRPSRNAPPCPSRGSGRDGRGFPRPVSLGAQDPETWSGDQVGVLDPVVIAHSARPMAARQTQFTGGGAVRPRLAVRWVGGLAGDERMARPLPPLRCHCGGRLSGSSGSVMANGKLSAPCWGQETTLLRHSGRAGVAAGAPK